jgi:hypothetical protein
MKKEIILEVKATLVSIDPSKVSIERLLGNRNQS